jgi:hypothetical protein
MSTTYVVVVYAIRHFTDVHAMQCRVRRKVAGTLVYIS